VDFNVEADLLRERFRGTGLPPQVRRANQPTKSGDQQYLARLGREASWTKRKVLQETRIDRAHIRRMIGSPAHFQTLTPDNRSRSWRPRQSQCWQVQALSRWPGVRTRSGQRRRRGAGAV